MPTNLLRSRSTLGRAAHRDPEDPGAARVLILEGRSFAIRITLAATATADLLWAILPVHATLETWGDCIHVELPCRTGRDRGARTNARLGEAYFWAEEQRILVPFGPTPISREGEIRLPQPLNVIGEASDVSILRNARVGEKVALRRLAA